MTPDELLDTLEAANARNRLHIALINYWPDIAASLKRLTAAEADADRLAVDARELRRAKYALQGIDAPPPLPDSALALHDARRSQP